MTGKTLIKFMVLCFISAITACSTGGGGDFPERQERAPATRNQAEQPANNNTTNNNSPETSSGGNPSTEGTADNRETTNSASPSPRENTPPAQPTTNNTAPVTAGLTTPDDKDKENTATVSENKPVADNPPAAPVTPADQPKPSTDATENKEKEKEKENVTVSEPPVVKPEEIVPPKETSKPKLSFRNSSGQLFGTNLSDPVVLPTAAGKVINLIGTDEFREKSTDTTNKRLSNYSYDDSKFLSEADIDPQKVQTLEVKDNTGSVVGTFQFVKQSQSVYMTFMPKFPRAQADMSVEYFTGLFGYIATPTSDEEFAKLTGEAKYTGKVIGYSYPLKVGDKINSNYPNYNSLPSHPEQAKPAKITLTVNFDTKMVDGEITERFDHLGGRNFKWTDDDDKVTQQGLDFDKKSLYLSGKIEKVGTAWGFKGPFNSTEGVYVDKEKRKNVAGLAGIFVGEGAKEVVGIITSKESMMFGATKDSQ